MVTTRRGSQQQDNTSVSQAATSSTSQRGRGRGSARGRGRGRSAAAIALADRDIEQAKLVNNEAVQEFELQNHLAGKAPYPEPVVQDPAKDASSQDGLAGAGYPITRVVSNVSTPVEDLVGSGRKHRHSTEAGRMIKDSGNEIGVNQVSGKKSGGQEGDGEMEGGEMGGSDAGGRKESSGEESSDEQSSEENGSLNDLQDEGAGVSEDDDAIFGSNIMSQLASSLKAALKARAGLRESSPAVLHSGSADKKFLSLTSDPTTIRWNLDVEQSKAAAAKGPVLGVGVTKEKGLQRMLLAPPRVNSTEHGPSETSRWFQLPATKITDEVKQELRCLRLRGAYDPQRFYKSFDETKFPKHFQIGTVLDNPQDFYSSRLTARERGTSITEELLADAAVTAVRKKRYNRLQEEAARYQKVKKRKTDLARTIPKPKRPKH